MTVVFRATGCDGVVEDVGGPALGSTRRLSEEREATFSRFRSGSELERVNAVPGGVAPTSAEFRVPGRAVACNERRRRSVERPEAAA